jgi:hypothetical protein
LTISPESTNALPLGSPLRKSSLNLASSKTDARAAHAQESINALTAHIRHPSLIPTSFNAFMAFNLFVSFYFFTVSRHCDLTVKPHRLETSIAYLRQYSKRPGD